MTLLAIHDANLKKVAFIDNEKQSTLHYFDDVWTRNLETGSSTFEFTVLKKPTDNTYNYLNEKAFVSFKHNGKSYVFNVMTVEENEQTVTCYCENLNLELINEYANPYKASKAMTFVEYCNAMDLLNFTYLSVGINEISDQKRTLEWDGQDTKLARLLSLAKKFDAEIDFDTQLNADSTIKSFKVNVYHENDDTHQGVGRIRNDIQLIYGKNLKSITRKIDKTNIVNAIRPTGTKDGNTVVISGLSAWEEKNADGIVEFYQKGEMLYAPISMQLYPSTFTHDTIADQWTRKDITVDSDDQAVIRSAGIRELKKNAYPAITYDVDGFVDVEIGDTVKINDDGFNPVSIVEARVSDQKISFTNPDNNKTTFANFKALENRISDDMQARLNELVEQAKPYTIKLATNNGVVFKNKEGETIVTPMLYKGGQPSVASVVWKWTLDGVTTTGMTFRVNGYDVKETSNLIVSAYVDNILVASTEVTLTNVNDGAPGEKGDPGPAGVSISNIKPYFILSNTPTGVVRTSGTWSTTPLTPTLSQKYVWTYLETTLSNGTKQYSEPYITGVYGDKGDQGVPGQKGADGRTPYIHWAYSDNADGTGLTTSDNGQRYIGQYTDYTQTDSTDKTKYRWSDRWAKIEVGGVNQISLTGALKGYRLGVNGENLTDSLHTLTKFIPVKYANYVLSYDGELDSNPNYYYSLAWYSSQNTSGFISRPTGSARQTNLMNWIKLTPPANATHLRVSFPTNFDKVMLNGGTVKLNWSQSPEDIQANIDSKADQEKVVYKTDISVTDEGIVHSASKTVNGQTIASMIAQRAEWVEIIAKLLKVKGDMIVDGTIGANKLSVSTLSALTADLGQISGGSLKLLKGEAQATSVDAWGSFTIPAHKSGLYIDNRGVISSGRPVRKSSSESTASDMPIAVLRSGQLRFARANQSNDLEGVLSYDLSDFDSAAISFTVTSDGTKQLLIQANGQIVNQATNYTIWLSTGAPGVYYKRQGDVVALKLQVTTTANQNYDLGRIPAELIPIPNNGTMMRVASWTADQNFGRNLQINSDGSMALLSSNRGDTFNTQVTWII